jgi:hypothetical protein
MATTYTPRTRPTTTYTARPRLTKWIDYLFGDNQGVEAIVQDQDWNDISIFADTWYEQVTSWASRTGRTRI